MGCYSCGGNPNTFCGECNYPKDTWIAPVDSLPDTFMGDFDHLYRTPDGNLYALSPERDRWIRVNGEAGNQVTFKGGNGISIDNKGVITNTKPNENQSLSINGRTISISNGNSITLPEDRDTVYNDTELKRRVQAVESKTDNFVSGVSVSRVGNKVKLTYTFVNGAPKEVEFEDKDTVTLAYDDSALKARVSALETKQDRDNQTLTLDSNSRVLSISNGNTVTLPNDKQTIRKNGNKLILSNGGGEIDLPQPNNAVSYDDTNLRNRIGALEAKQDRDNQTLTLNNRTISISGGNSITLPEDRDTVYNDTDIKRRLTALEGKSDRDNQSLTVNGNNLSISGGNTVTLPTPTPYNDADIKRRLGVLEAKRDNDNQTLTLNNRTISISGGNSITLPEDRDTVYNDTDIKRRLTALEGKSDRDNQSLTVNGNNLSISGGNTVTLPTPTPYNDADIKRRLGVLEAKRDNDNQTLSVSGNTISLSGGNSVTIPQAPVHRFYNGDIPGRAESNTIVTVNKSNFRNPDGIKVGDTAEDHWADHTVINRGIWKVIEVSGNNVKVQGIGNYDVILRKNLTFNANTRVLSIDGGSNNITLPNDKQTISKSGNKIVLSNGGGEVDIPQPNLSGYVTVQQYNELKGALEKILQDLKNSGAWHQTGSNVFQGQLYGDRHIATGNINLFGGTPDGGSFIRTSNNRTENDLAGGI